MKKIHYLLIFISIVLLTFLFKIQFHSFSISPVIACLFFIGTVVKSTHNKLLIGLGLWFLSDFALNNLYFKEYYGISEGLVLFQPYMIGIALAVAVILLLAKVIRTKTPISYLLGTIGSGLIFYLITNFIAWLQDPMYVKSMAGLIESYTLALPFYRSAVLGDFIFGILFYGAWFALPKAIGNKEVNKPIFFNV